ncbi:MAG TPA: zinc ribbon domain-containing protein [Pyrinomonadaceae bacterium]|nr:zinc ribbon domain-containing protein [Pyrinomonadaceae bacterium]
MFCPKCATQNLDGASFCRTCGANISLVPQALTGQLAQPASEEIVEGRHRGKRRKEVTLDQAFKHIFMGIAFLVIAIALSRSIGEAWWFWLLLPAFSMMGTGIAQYMRLRERGKQGPLPEPPSVARTFPQPARPTEQLPPPVPSVTEGTTRHLDQKERT